MSLEVFIDQFREYSENVDEKTTVKQVLEDINAMVKSIKQRTSNTIPFGKHRGRTVLYVFQNQPSYINFLRKQDCLTRYPEIKEEIEKLIKVYDIPIKGTKENGKDKSIDI
jgi:hypothetical protein